jgi:hypothetical protein
VHIEAVVAESDADEVDPIGPQTSRQPCHSSPLRRVHTIDWVSTLVSGPHLDDNTLCSISSDEIDLSTARADVP